MSITISLLLVLAILICIFLKAKTWKRIFFYQFVLLMTLEFNEITSTAAFIGSQEINCSDPVLASLAITAVIFLLKGVRANKKLVISIRVLCVAVFFCVLFNVIFPYEGITIDASGSWDAFYYGREAMNHVAMGFHTILVLIRLMLWLLILYESSVVLTSRDFLTAARYVVTFTKIHIVWATAEFITKTFFGSVIMVTLAQIVFPAASSVYTTLNIRGNIRALQGFTREPSHFALALTFFLLLILLLKRQDKSDKRDIPWVVSAIFLLLFSGAFTAIVGIVILLFFNLYFYEERKIKLINKENKKKCFGIHVALLIISTLIIMFIATDIALNIFSNIYYVQKLNNVLKNINALFTRDYGALSGTSDALPRMISIVECLYIFIARPLFGVGPGIVNPFSGIVSILANYGIIITICWFAVIYQYAKCFSGKKGACLFVVMVILLGLVLLSGDYIYNSKWLLLGGLFGQPLKNFIISSEKYDFISTQNSCSMPKKVK